MLIQADVSAFDLGLAAGAVIGVWRTLEVVIKKIASNGRSQNADNNDGNKVLEAKIDSLSQVCRDGFRDVAQSNRDLSRTMQEIMKN